MKGEKIIIALTFALVVGASYFNVDSKVWGNIQPLVDQLYLMGIYLFLGCRYYKHGKPNKYIDICLAGLIVTQFCYVIYGFEKSVIRLMNPHASDPELAAYDQEIFNPCIPASYFFAGLAVMFLAYKYIFWYRFRK